MTLPLKLGKNFDRWPFSGVPLFKMKSDLFKVTWTVLVFASLPLGFPTFLLVRKAIMQNEEAVVWECEINWNGGEYILYEAYINPQIVPKLY